MKVSDIMQKNVITVSEITSLKEVSRLIFSLGIKGIPVLKGRKLVGIITEQDILSKMYPTMGELMEDYTHSKNFEEMENHLLNLLDLQAKDIMNKKVVSAMSETPIMEAQSMMLVKKFSRLPIVDKKRNLVGIVSQGDIFRQLIKKEVPKIEEERFAGFMGRHYDLMVNWEKRFNFEFPTLFKELKKEKVKSILDLGSWTGEYAINLARKGGFKVLGLDHNQTMIKMSKDKLEHLSGDLKKIISFSLLDNIHGFKISEKFDALISMGNALSYIPFSLSELFSEATKVLRENGIIVLQLLNYEKILKEKNRFLSFVIQKTNLAYEKEHLFVEFIDIKSKNTLLHHVIIFDSDGTNWIYKGVTTVPIKYITKEEIKKMLKKSGFGRIRFAGSRGKYRAEYGPLSFDNPFDKKQSDWLNIVAKR